ncbi:MAG TPA: PspC domain-containing protein [Egibacteraceae bacterium]|nr:PspC domain-containing protein [Egibacteraceae bacterium]
MDEVRKLTRSEDERLIAGVCGGLAQYFGVDATLMRVLFVVAAVFGGAGLWAYLAIWLIVPRTSKVGASARDVVKDNVAEGQQLAQDGVRAAREALQGRRGST